MNLTDEHTIIDRNQNYESGPEDMPRVERLPYAVMECLIEHSLFKYHANRYLGEDRDRLYGLIHDVAEEVLARVSLNSPDRVQLPQNRDQAVAMLNLASMWLAQNGEPANAPVVEPSLLQINDWMRDAGWQNSDIRQADLHRVAQVVGKALSAVPTDSKPAGEVGDSEMLDWISKNARCDPKMGGNHMWWPTSFNRAIYGNTLRLAIAAAINAEKAKP